LDLARRLVHGDEQHDFRRRRSVRDQQHDRSTSGGHNIVGGADACGFGEPTDMVEVSSMDLALGPLADNGGPTMTHALLSGSVAIDVIPEAMCQATEDQRGEPRPAGGMCDVGAFEVQP
jgi:hypothetical protein